MGPMCNHAHHSFPQHITCFVKLVDTFSMFVRLLNGVQLSIASHKPHLQVFAGLVLGVSCESHRDIQVITLKPTKIKTFLRVKWVRAGDYLFCIQQDLTQMMCIFSWSCQSVAASKVVPLASLD